MKASPMPLPTTQRQARRAVIDEERFAEDVALMLRSGLTLSDALKTLGERTDDRRGPVIQQLIQRLREGDTLSRAMSESGCFKPALIAAVKSSEVSGDMANSLERYAQNAARFRAMRAKMLAALVYPAVLAIVSLLVVIFLIVFVVPRFAVVLEGAGRDLPTMSLWLIALGKSLNALPTQAWVAVAGAAALAGWQVWGAARDGRLESSLADVASRMPVAGRLVRTFGRAQLARTGSMLVRSGIPAIRALGMCRDLLPGDARLDLERALSVASTGMSLADSLFEHGIVDALGLRVLRVAEQTGQLHLALERLADIQDHEVERALERVGRLVEPVMMLGIGLVIGGIVVLMYLPIFQLASSVG